MCGVLWQEEAWGAEGSAGEERRGQGATVASEASGCVPKAPHIQGLQVSTLSSFSDPLYGTLPGLSFQVKAKNGGDVQAWCYRPIIPATQAEGRSIASPRPDRATEYAQDQARKQWDCSNKN